MGINDVVTVKLTAADVARLEWARNVAMRLAYADGSNECGLLGRLGDTMARVRVAVFNQSPSAYSAVNRFADGGWYAAGKFAYAYESVNAKTPAAKMVFEEMAKEVA